MKILLITNILTNYREISYELMYEEFTNLGHEFKIFVMSSTEPLRPWNYSSYAKSYTELLKGKTKSLNVFGVDRYIHFNKEVIKKVNEFNPDITILSGSSDSPTILKVLLYTRIFKKNRILAFWGETFEENINTNGRLKRIKRYIWRNFYNSFDLLCSPGRRTDKFMNSWLVSEKPILRLSNIVNSQLYSQANQIRANTKAEIRINFDIPTGKFCFVIPARLIDVKGIIPFLNNTWDILNKLNACIVIAGQGPLKESIIELSKSKNIDVRILGQLDPEDLVKLYGCSDCFLLPSLSDANPLSAIEAAWAGLPFLVSNKIGNYPELVEDSMNGFVFNPIDKEDTRAKTEMMLESNTMWLSNASKISFEIAHRNFDERSSIKNFCQLLTTRVKSK